MTSQTTTPQPATATPTVETPEVERRSRRRSSTLLSKLGETLAALFALAVAGSLWYLGAQFTLLALEAIGIPVVQLGYWRWLIPAGISAVELRWWPRGVAETKALSFAVVALIDGASTLYGLVLWGAGRTLPLATGLTIPHAGLGLVVPALLAALVLTFVPERLTLRMLSELRLIWERVMLDALANNPLLQLLLLGAAIAAAVWVTNHRERRQRVSHRTISSPLPPAAIVSPPSSSDVTWLAQLRQALHLLIIGHSQGGKTTLVHELVRQFAVAGNHVVVCDPDAAPGLWPGCKVYGYANDLAAIERALADMRAEVERRRTLRGRGRQRTFPPLYLVIDEYQDIGRAGGCPEARPLIEDVLRRGGKLNVHLIIGVQDKQVKTMGFEGQGDLRRNFTSIVEVRADRGGHRWATVSTPTDEAAIATYEVPPLPDLERLIEAAPQPSPARSIGAPTATTVTSREMPADAAGTRREMPENDAENLRSVETHFPAAASDFALSEVPFSVEELAQMAAMIARGGMGKTEVVQAMPGYSGRKHKAYAACYDRLRTAIDALAGNSDLA